MSSDKILNSYRTNGFYIWKSFYDSEYCIELKKYLSFLPAKLTIPYTNIPWGYGNLLRQGPFKNITEDARINQICKDVFSDSYIFNHLYVHNKVKWIGKGIEWHQELFNIDTYAPGYDSEKDWEKFIQFYVPLDHQNLKNGCIKVFPGSHKLGILDHEDVMDENFGHKRRVTYEVMNQLQEKCGVKNCILNPGDLLIFNHRLVHGSPSNNSPYDRKAIVLQAREDSIVKNDEVFQKEKKYRRNFVLEGLNNKLKEMNSQDLYNDFKVKKRKEDEDK
jgi:hypothetical protein|tara:strand:- start:1628 stop:2455 length:828 start_codon:yes stop_codon:yes gene_type:complete